MFLLADFFERFHATCLEYYNLDPVHYYTTHGLACNAALRMSRVDLQLITDGDMYHYVENSIQGGISMISTRHAQTNSPSNPDTYDSSLPNQNLSYLDANNLYGWAMSQSLPTHGFRFLQQGEISTLKLKELSDDAEGGYIFEVDLHYPIHLHDRHDDYPLGSESLVIDRSMYSSIQQAVFPESAPQRKRTPNLRDNVKYVVHYRNLKLYLLLGLVVNKVNRVFTIAMVEGLYRFQHSSMFTSFFKEMNNRVFGKTQEYLRNRVHVELVTDARILRKRVAKPNFWQPHY